MEQFSLNGNSPQRNQQQNYSNYYPPQLQQAQLYSAYKNNSDKYPYGNDNYFQKQQQKNSQQHYYQQQQQASYSTGSLPFVNKKLTTTNNNNNSSSNLITGNNKFGQVETGQLKQQQKTINKWSNDLSKVSSSPTLNNNNNNCQIVVVNDNTNNGSTKQQQKFPINVQQKMPLNRHLKENLMAENNTIARNSMPPVRIIFIKKWILIKLKNY